MYNKLNNLTLITDLHVREVDKVALQQRKALAINGLSLVQGLQNQLALIDWYIVVILVALSIIGYLVVIRFYQATGLARGTIAIPILPPV